METSVRRVQKGAADRNVGPDEPGLEKRPARPAPRACQNRAVPTEPLDAAPSISVVVCAFTTERLPVLGEAIESLRTQTLPAREIVLVIDHAPELLEEARRRWPDLEIVVNREK